MRSSRVLRVACLAAVMVLLPGPSAKACSCALGDPRDAFARADGAFVGTFLESHLAEPPEPGEPFSSGEDTIYSFRLDEEYKGELGEPGDIVEVHAPFSGASCGIEAREGEQYGLFLTLRDDGEWSSSLCSQVSPRTLREAASPLPAPDGQGRVELLLGGSFGKAQVMGLDGRGRTLGYGFGGSDVTHIDVCPGRERALEIAQSYPEPPHLFVRDLSSYRTVRELELPYGRGKLYPRQDPSALDCRSRLGNRLMIFSTNQREPEAKSLILKIKGREGTPLHRGTGRSATFAARRVFLQAGRWGRSLVAVSLRTGAERPVAKLPRRHSTPLSLSPDGSRLAGIAYPPYDDQETKSTLFYTVDVSGPRSTVRTRPLATGEVYGTTGWMSARRPVAFMEYPGPSRVFDLRLRRVARFGRWPARDAAFVGRRAFGASYDGSLFAVRLPDGDVRKVRKLPSPVVYAVVPVR